MGRKRWSAGRSLLIVVGLFVVLSHVCALPVHAAGLTTFVGHTHGTHDEPSADDAIHGASCEAVRSTFAAPPMLSATPATPAPVVTHIVQRPLERPRSAVTTSPPLFLLHASLLI